MFLVARSPKKQESSISTSTSHKERRTVIRTTIVTSNGSRLLTSILIKMKRRSTLEVRSSKKRMRMKSNLMLTSRRPSELSKTVFWNPL